MFLTEPYRTQYDLNFSIARIPVRVHPLFWLATVVLGSRRHDIKELLIWVGVVFVSILVHELGHAFTMRRFGEWPRVVLYLMGGLAIADSGYGRSRSPARQIMVSAAGPAAGFALATLTVAAVYAGGGAMVFSFSDGLSGLWDTQLPGASTYLRTLIDDLLWVNTFWGLLNLLPVYPLDGGQIARVLFVQRDPWDGVRKSLLVSVVTAAVLAGFGLIYLHSLLMALLFGSLAFSSWQATQHRASGGW